MNVLVMLPALKWSARRMAWAAFPPLVLPLLVLPLRAGAPVGRGPVSVTAAPAGPTYRSVAPDGALVDSAWANRLPSPS